MPYKAGLLGILFFIFAVLPVKSECTGKSRSPSNNFLLITIDTLRADRLSCYDKHFVQTPNIDTLAEKGILFSRAFAHTPTTLPSHASILVGATPLYHGIHENSQFILRDEFLTLAEHLKTFGYSTAAFVGAFPLDSRFGLNQGFDVYDDQYGHPGNQTFSYVERRAEEVVNRSLKWLENQNSPWFLWMHVYDPHQRYDPPEPFKTEHSRHPYEGEVAYVDHCLGKFFEYLDLNQLSEKTLIILTSDHGEGLGDHGEKTHGYFAYNSTLHVPLILFFPGLKPGKTKQYVCHSDIFPTACDILDIKEPKGLQGISLVPALKGKGLPERKIYFESLYPFYSRNWAPLRGFFRQDIKYIDLPLPEIYDLEKDFTEQSNLASSENSPLYQRELNEFIQKNSLMDKGQSIKKADPDTLRKLKSLGYVAGASRPSPKKKYASEDDLKTLLPYQNKLMESMRAYDREDYEKGKIILQGIIAERKDLTQAYAYLAETHKKTGAMEQAVKILEQGCEQNPDNFSLLQTLGITLVEAGRFEKAINILQQSLDIIDYDPEVWNYLGVAYWHQGEFEKAESAYQKVLEWDENYPVVFNNLGALYLSRSLKLKSSEDLRSAISYFNQAVKLDPEYGEAYNGLGSAFGQAGQLNQAVSFWEKALDCDSSLTEPLFNLGLAHRALGNKGQALSYFIRYKNRHSHKLNPGEKKKLEALLAELQK